MFSHTYVVHTLNEGVNRFNSICGSIFFIFIVSFSIICASCKSYDDYRRRVTAYGCQNGIVNVSITDTESKGMYVSAM